MSGWTIETLKDHLLALLGERDKAIQAALEAAKEAVQAALTAADRAVAKAEAAAEKRFEGVNEFRATLSDQAASFVTRSEHDATVKSLVEKIDDLKSRADSGSGHAQGLGDGWKYVTGAAAFIATLGTIAVLVVRFVH